IGLQGRLQDSTPANSLSDATNFNIVPLVRPRFDTAHNLADKALFELYAYDSVNGKLTINRLPLTITPNNDTITYGDPVNVTFNYTLGSANISAADASTIQNNLVLDHQGSMAPNTVALVDGKSISKNFFLTLGFIASGKS